MAGRRQDPRKGKEAAKKDPKQSKLCFKPVTQRSSTAAPALAPISAAAPAAAGPPPAAAAGPPADPFVVWHCNDASTFVCL